MANAKAIEDEFKKYVENKRIIIVGPSASLLSQCESMGEFIDSFDIVIRIKKGFPVPTELVKNIGGRIDILYTNLKMIENNLDARGIKQLVGAGTKYIVCPFPTDTEPFSRFIADFMRGGFRGEIPVKTSSGERAIYDGIKRQMDGFQPTTFIASFIDLLKYDFKSLHITGITFRRDGYINNYKTPAQDKASYDRTIKIKKIHNMDSELALFSKLYWANRERITLDARLGEIVIGDVDVDTNKSD